MKKIIITCFFLFASFSLLAQVKDYDPSIQRTTHMQYFKPVEKHLFAGDCMPYYHDGTFYLYWLLDEDHHRGLGGLGGHQWALSTSKDLKTWKHYPIALGIDEEWEKSICTGSVIAEGNKFYAFYSTRVKEGDKVHEQLSYAISTDKGISYKKQKPNPFYYAPEECLSRDFRDPKVFKAEDGLFHMFISGYQKDPVMGGQGGYLVHLQSKDLKNWTETTSPLSGQAETPECSDYFKWNDWYYLIYSVGGDASYVKSKNPYGPWEYPSFQPMVEQWGNVAKTAEFKNGRRIAVAYMNGKENNKDSERQVWGGSILLREMFQDKDGVLTIGLLPEVLPSNVLVATPKINTLSTEGLVNVSDKEISFNSPNTFSTAVMSALPKQYRISMTIEPEGNYDELGLYFRATDKHTKGYKLGMNANKEIVSLFETKIESVKGLRDPIKIDAFVMDDVIDVYINNERTIVNRLAEQKGDDIIFFIKNGSAKMRDFKIYKID